MSTALLFLEECEKFRKWLDDPETSPDSLEIYAASGIIPEPPSETKSPRMSTQRNPNLPPQGDFQEGSTWFHPRSQEMFLYRNKTWVRSEENTKTTSQKVKYAASLYGVHCYYQSLTHQFKFSCGECSWTATVEELETYLANGKTLEDYFKPLVSFIADYSSGLINLDEP